MRFIGYAILLLAVIIIVIPVVIIRPAFWGRQKPLPRDVQAATVRLYAAASEQVVSVDMEEYIKGVVAAEMPSEYEVEALKAQAVAARTYTVSKIKRNAGMPDERHPDADLCTDSTHCQAWISREDAVKGWGREKGDMYWDKISRCVEDTRGEILVYEGEPIDAVFHASSSGKTEEAQEVWGGDVVPYLKSVESDEVQNSSRYVSTAVFLQGEITKMMQKNYPDFKLNLKSRDAVKIMDYTAGKRVKNIILGNKELTGVELRKIFNLKSADFTFSISGTRITFTVKGYGHGVGMSQNGAECMALDGKGYRDILLHYYQGVRIEKIRGRNV